MSKLKTTEMRLSVIIQDGYDLLDEFKFMYKKFSDMLPDFPKSMAAEKAEINKLMQEMAAQSRELKQEIKAANVVVSHIEGHIAWKAAVRACFGEEGIQQCFRYFENLEEAK